MTTSNTLPQLTAEQRRAAAGQYERANQVLKQGNYDYALQLLQACCTIDPGNPIYRQALRQGQKNKYQNNMKGQSLTFLTTFKARVSMKSALRSGNYTKVLEIGENILMRNPWDVGAQLAMSKAFDELGVTPLALWTLDQARQLEPNNAKINRPLARLFEKVGNYQAAIALWEMVRKAEPRDLEAQHKYKDLAASATIAKGGYEGAAAGQGKTPLVGPLSGAPADPKVTETTMEHQLGVLTAPMMPAASAPKAAPATAATAEEKVPREVANLRAKIKANPTNPNGYLHLASLYRRNDQFEQARQVLQEGLTPTANHFEMAMELADLEIEEFRRDLAMTEQILSKNPGDQDLRELRGHLNKEITARELEYFRKKADRYPTEVSHRFEMGVRLYKNGQFDEAIRELQGIRTDPRYQGKALVYLGFCFASRNNWRLAQRNFEEALRHLPPSEEHLRKDILFHLAKGYADSGELNRAIDTACELANLDYGYKDIGKLLDEWNAKMQKA